MTMMMGLGTYRFSMDSAAYQSLRRIVSYRWKSQDRINNTTAMQYVGRGPETLTLKGMIYPEYRGGLGQITKMRAEAERGERLLMFDKLGYDWGYWVITQLEETQTVFMSGNVPRKISFQMNLTAYGEDRR